MSNSFSRKTKFTSFTTPPQRVSVTAALSTFGWLAVGKTHRARFYACRSCATLARGFQNSRAGRFPQLRKPFTELFLAIQTPVLLMNVPDRKFCPIPATHALKYIAQVVANRVRRDSHKPGDIRVCEAGCNKHGDGELAGCQHIHEGEFLFSSFGSHIAPSPLAHCQMLEARQRSRKRNCIDFRQSSVENL